MNISKEKYIELFESMKGIFDYTHLVQTGYNPAGSNTEYTFTYANNISSVDFIKKHAAIIDKMIVNDKMKKSL